KQVGRIDVSAAPSVGAIWWLLGVGNSGSQKVGDVPSRRVRRPRNTNDREDRAIREWPSAPTTSLASIQRHLPPSRHPVPSRETIRRRRPKLARSRRPLRRLPLTHIIGSVDWIFVPTSATWSVTDWRRVIFSDESRFILSADDHRTRVWRRTASGPIRHLLSSGIQQFHKV
ncbi:HTH_Tnp_Tc3_2 domain-containing protein, partial [Trichonephila clavipes]